MDVGRLRHRVGLQQPAGSRDAVGERVTTWSTQATVWGSVEPLSAKDLIAAAQMESELTHRVTIRHSSAVAAITAAWRVSFGSRTLVVNSVRNIGERNEMLELLCSEGVRTE